MQVLDFFRKNPFLRLLAAYGGGLYIAYHIEAGRVAIYLMSAAACAAAVVTAGLEKGRWQFRYSSIFGIGVFIVLFLAGMVLGCLGRVQEKAVLRDLCGAGVYRARITGQPEEGQGSIRAVARLEGGMKDNLTVKRHAMVILYVEKDSLSERLAIGTTIHCEAKPEPVAGPLNPGEFDYRRYLSDRKIWLRAWLEPGRWQIREAHGRWNLRSAAAGIREVLLDRYRRLDLTKEEYGVLAALTLGYKHDLETHTVSLFSKAGVLHVMALSGFNVGIIAAFLAWMLSLAGKKRMADRIRIPLTILAVWVFAWVTGLSPSVTRASVMLSFVLSGKLLARHVNTCNILFASAFFILACRPGLIADVGFQLSFAAVLGIIFLQPLMVRGLKFHNHLMQRMWQLFTVSCAAQLATLPLTLYCFNQFPLYFWLTNLYVIPLVSCIICLSGVYLMLSWLKPLAWLSGRILSMSVRGLLLGLSPVERMPGALIDGIHISGPQAFILAMLILLLGVCACLRKRSLLLPAFAALAAFLILSTVHRFRQEKQQWLVINHIRGISALNLISGHRSLLLADPDTAVTASMIAYSFQDFWIEKGVQDRVLLRNPFANAGGQQLVLEGAWIRQHVNGDNLFILFEDKRLLWLKNLNGTKSTGQRLRVDCLVVSGTVRADVATLQQYIDFPLLVIDTSSGRDRAREWTADCRKNNICCWDIHSQGAFCLVPGD